MGGPVYLPKLYDGHNKSFFFVAHQQLKQPSVPYLWARGGITQAELEGDFSRSTKIPVVSTTAANVPNSPFAGRAGQQITNLAPFLSPHAVNMYKVYKLPIVNASNQRT